MERDSGKSSSTIGVLSTPVKVVASLTMDFIGVESTPGSRTRFLGCDPKVTMGDGVDVDSSSALKWKMHATIKDKEG
jgi:hypothetical protein